MSLLELKGIQKKYEGAPLIKGVDLNVDGGETLCLLGRSGSGKSTLLRIIAGLEPADAGVVLWNGKDLAGLPPWQRNFGLMFQDYALFPHYNVEENVVFGLDMQGMKKESIKQRVGQVLDLVNMDGFEKRRVTDLSGGEQQRIALARALAPEPRLLMLDEPLAALDRMLRAELQEELRALLHKTGIPVIYVTHDQEEAFILGDRLAILAEGVIAQQGRPEAVFQSPANRRVAEFLGMTNFIEGEVLSTHPLQVRTSCGILHCDCETGGLETGRAVTLLIQPAAGMFSAEAGQENRIKGKVSECIFKGEEYKITLDCEGCPPLVFHVPFAHAIAAEVEIVIPSRSIFCLVG